MDAVHEGDEDVYAAAQDFRAKARLAVERDEARFDRAPERPQLLDDADLVVGDVAEDIGCADERNHQDGRHQRNAEPNKLVHS